MSAGVAVALALALAAGMAPELRAEDRQPPCPSAGAVPFEGIAASDLCRFLPVALTVTSARPRFDHVGTKPLRVELGCAIDEARLVGFAGTATLSVSPTPGPGKGATVTLVRADDPGLCQELTRRLQRTAAERPTVSGTVGGEPYRRWVESSPGAQRRLAREGSPPWVAPTDFVFHEGPFTSDLEAYVRATPSVAPDALTTANPSAEADVTGDAQPERLRRVGRFALVEAPDRRGYFVRDVGPHGQITSLEARAITGPGLDVIVRYTVHDPRVLADKPERITSVAHFVIELWTLRGPVPRRLFGHEHEAWATCCGSEAMAPPRVVNEIVLSPQQITVRPSAAWRATADSFRPRPVGGVEPLLLPWGPVKERVFRWDGTAFVAVLAPR